MNTTPSVVSSFSTAYKLQDNSDLPSSKHASNSSLTVSITSYLACPSAATASALYKATQTVSLSTQCSIVSHTKLCLKLLDTLANNLLVKSSEGEEETSTQDLQPTQCQDPREEALQLLELCYRFTRRTGIGYPSHTLCKLLQWLVDNLSVSIRRKGCETDTKLKLQLLVFAELIKSSAGACLVVKEMQTTKEFYRLLTILLNSTDEPELLVFSMTILARLVLSEPIGTKLFSRQNVDQVLALIFSVLNGSRHDHTNERMSHSTTTILDQRSLLQLVSVDLLCELANRHEVLEILEKYPKVAPTLDSCFMAISLNGDTEQILFASYFLSSIAQISHVMLKLLIKYLSDQDVLYQVLQATLHPSRIAATATAQLVLKLIGNDVRSFRNIFDSSADLERLKPIVIGMIRCANDATSLMQGSEDTEVLCNSDDYLHAVEVCHLLSKMSELSAIRTLCVETISLNQSAMLIQLESALINTADPEDFTRFHPQLSLYVVSLLLSIMFSNDMPDTKKRTLRYFLQTSEVALVLGAALISRTKDIVLDTLLLLTKSVTSSESKEFHMLGLAEAIVSYTQRAEDGSDSLRSRMCALQANAEVSTKTIGKLQNKLQHVLHNQDELKAQHDQALKSLDAKFAQQIRQTEEEMQQMRDTYEAKLSKIVVQCETMGQHMNQNIRALQHRDALLQESQTKRGVLEDENKKLDRKVQVLETRIEEITHSYSIAMNETKLRDKKLEESRDKIATIFEDYTVQREELEVAHDEIKRLQAEICEQKLSNEDTYKELVLLAKAHQALSDAKKTCENEVDTIRDKLTKLESLNISIQSQLQKKEELADELQRKIALLDDAAIVSRNALTVEREKCRSVVRDFDNLRNAHRKLESDMTMLEMRVAEQRRVVELKDKQLHKYEEEVCQLSIEVGKQTKLQALIHQLSSGADNNVKIDDGSSHLLHDK